MADVENVEELSLAVREDIPLPERLRYVPTQTTETLMADVLSELFDPGRKHLLWPHTTTEPSGTYTDHAFLGGQDWLKAHEIIAPSGSGKSSFFFRTKEPSPRKRP